VLLAASHIVRAVAERGEAAPPPSERSVQVLAVADDRIVGPAIRLAYWDVPSRAGADAPIIVVIHGSPGDGRDVLSLAPRLSERYRVIVPDMPGFGASSHVVPDYSFRAHARYVLELLDALGIARAHFVAFSMGGGVALNVADIAPDRVASLTMLSAIGVQEMELLGDYNLNHALHGLQLGALWFLREAVPHFGLFDGSALGVEYARNFYDSDQRPLRGALEHYAGPMLIIHGRRDPLVPLEAALEHHRLVPQSELVLRDDDHFMVFKDGGVPASIALEFVSRVDAGAAATRATAAPERVELAARPYDPRSAPRAMGVAALVMIVLLAVATLVSEDLTCIGAGVMVANGRIDFVLAAFGCLLGIFVGDILLFLAGRYLGRPALRSTPLRWFVRAADVDRCSEWFQRRGAVAIFASRFVPGTRLPTYFAAGLLDTSFVRFTLYFLVAALVWTPALVWIAMEFGAKVGAALVGGRVLGGALVAIAITYVAVRVGLGLLTWRGRRSLVGQWGRLVRWEFWPPWAFYPPVVCYVAYLALKHRGLTVFAAANPAIPDGGFVGESKTEILRGLSRCGDAVARFERIAITLAPAERVARARAFVDSSGLGLPIVVKPDVGQRGEGVVVARTDDAFEAALFDAQGDVIVQEYIPGVEFGVFYVRHPDEPHGRIFAITEKLFPEVEGDGRSTLEELILRDERAVAMARTYFDLHGDHLWEVPAHGERVQLVEIGTHCRGAVFLDGAWAKTDPLEAAIDEIARGFDGFYFGRFDVRVPSRDAFVAGRDLRVVELNGVTSEATNIYDPKNTLLDAYRVLFRQWRLAFEIGFANRARGHAPIGVRALASRILAFWFRTRDRAVVRPPAALAAAAASPTVASTGARRRRR
jgi:membrane protein DedA with SNARE-associated domain/pimeloyl-ACP methyl ester carboxylesterase